MITLEQITESLKHFTEITITDTGNNTFSIYSFIGIDVPDRSIVLADKYRAMTQQLVDDFKNVDAYANLPEIDETTIHQVVDVTFA